MKTLEQAGFRKQCRSYLAQNIKPELRITKNSIQGKHNL